jgi:predicted protein tyrosine phosphatase
MRVASLNQKLIILGQDELLSLPSAFLSDWSVLSITGRGTNKLYLPEAKAICRLHFDDVEKDAPETDHFAATEADIEKGIGFARQVGNDHLLIHCYAGISRSTAMAWIIIWDKLRDKADAVRLSFGIVRQIRPILLPNRHVLMLGINLLAPERARDDIVRQFQACLRQLDGGAESR